MDSEKPDAFVSGALAIVLQVSRFAGVAPLRFVKHRGGWRVSLSPYLHFYGCVLVTAMNAITVFAVIKDLQVEPAHSIRMQSSTRRIVWILDVAIMLSVVFHGAFAAPKHLKTMIVCLNYLQKINNELNVPHWPKRKEIKKCILLTAWTVLTIAVTLTDNILQISSVKRHHSNVTPYIMYMFYYFCYWVMQLLVYQFVLITLHIRQSFIAVNHKLKILSQGTSDFKKIPVIQGVFTVNKKNNKSVNTIIDSLAFAKVKTESKSSMEPAHETVRRLALTYLSICDIVREIDQRHGVILVLLLGSLLLHLTITPYYLINNAFDNNQTKGAFNICIQCVWCVFHSGDLVMVIEPCHLTLQEIIETRAQISQLMRHTSSCNDRLAVELDMFYRHLLLNKVSYSPLQITTLTRGLVATIVGTIVTYLVVIIQL